MKFITMNCGLRRGRRAFTIIEILVVVGIIGILGGIAADIFVNVTRSYNKASIIAEVQRNGNAALSQMALELRSARSIDSVSPFIFTNAEGKKITYALVPASVPNSGYVSRKVEASPATPITDPTTVHVTKLIFSLITDGSQSVVITMGLEQPISAPSRIDFQADVELKTTVSLRSY